MGRTLIRAQKTQFKPKSNGSSLGNGMSASGAGDLGVDKDRDEARTGMLSKLEADSLEDFIASAAMADREFESERERFVVLDGTAKLDERNLEEFGADGIGRGTREARGKDRFDFEGLKVPRRPEWDEGTTKEELDKVRESAAPERGGRTTPEGTTRGSVRRHIHPPPCVYRAGNGGWQGAEPGGWAGRGSPFYPRRTRERRHNPTTP